MAVVVRGGTFVWRGGHGAPVLASLRGEDAQGGEKRTEPSDDTLSLDGRPRAGSMGRDGQHAVSGRYIAHRVRGGHRVQRGGRWCSRAHGWAPEGGAPGRSVVKFIAAGRW